MKAATRNRIFYRASDVQAICNVDNKTIHNWADAGLLKVFRTPSARQRGHIRVLPIDLLSFLTRHGYPVPADVAALAAVSSAEPVAVPAPQDERARAIGICREVTLASRDFYGAETTEYEIAKAVCEAVATSIRGGAET